MFGDQLRGFKGGAVIMDLTAIALGYTYVLVHRNINFRETVHFPRVIVEARGSELCRTDFRILPHAYRWVG